MIDSGWKKIPKIHEEVPEVLEDQPGKIFWGARDTSTIVLVVQAVVGPNEVVRKRL